MQLTRGFEQGVCVITFLATQKKGIPVSSLTIHKRLQGSLAYSKKLIRKLIVAGLVTSVSGTNGGFTLAKDPKTINLYDIVKALEGNIVTYPGTGKINKVFRDLQKEAMKGEQVVIKAFDEADRLWRTALETKTVYELICDTIGKQTIPYQDWNKIS